MVTLAEDSRQASATEYPIPAIFRRLVSDGRVGKMRSGLPEVPPITKTCLPASLLYFWVAITMNLF